MYVNSVILLPCVFCVWVMEELSFLQQLYPVITGWHVHCGRKSLKQVIVLDRWEALIPKTELSTCMLGSQWKNRCLISTFCSLKPLKAIKNKERNTETKGSCSTWNTVIVLLLIQKEWQTKPCMVHSRELLKPRWNYHYYYMPMHMWWVFRILDIKEILLSLN